jgi:hypothetical protein
MKIQFGWQEKKRLSVITATGFNIILSGWQTHFMAQINRNFGDRTCFHYQGSDEGQYDKTSFTELEVPVAAFMDWPTPMYNFVTFVTINYKQWNPLEWQFRVAGTECFLLGLSVTVCFGTWTQKYKDIKPVTLRLWNNECRNAVSLSTALALCCTRSLHPRDLSVAAALTPGIVPLCTLKLIYVVYKYAARTSQRTQSATV